MEGGAMAGRRRSDRALPGKLRSPGRPGVASREDRRRFWAFIAQGLSSEDAAMEVGVSQPVGTRWFREAGGMAPSHLSRSSKPLSGRYLTFAEREEIALWRARGLGVREIARRSGRSASTISRELRRNAATRSGSRDYRATTAQWHAERAARRPKPAKLATNASLRTYVQERLAGAVVAPGGAAVPGPAVAWKGRRHGRRQPRRWAGALILGLGSSAIGTLVERTTRFTMLLHLPRMPGHGVGAREKNGPALAGHGAEAVRDAIARTITTLPEELRRSLTWDQGAEMAQHALLKVDAGVQVYFCDPQSPWQRGTNENTNGLLRQYFPKGTDLCAHDSDALAAVAATLNARPRKTLGWRTPAEAFDEVLRSTPASVATTP